MPVCAPLPLATARHVLAAMKSISADCKWRSIADEGRAFTRKTACRANQCPVPFAKIFRFTRRANHLYKFAPSHPTRAGLSHVEFAMLGVSMSRPGEGRDPYGADSRFGTGAKAFFPLLMPGVMGPGLRRDDPLRARTGSRPHQRTAQFSHMQSPCLAGVSHTHRTRGHPPPQPSPARGGSRLCPRRLLLFHR